MDLAEAAELVKEQKRGWSAELPVHLRCIIRPLTEWEPAATVLDSLGYKQERFSPYSGGRYSLMEKMEGKRQRQEMVQRQIKCMTSSMVGVRTELKQHQTQSQVQESFE